MKKRLVSVLLTVACGATLLAGCGEKATQETTTDTAEQTEAADTTADQTEATEEEAVDPAAYDGKEVKVWVAENVVDFTNQQIENFKTEYPQYAGVTFTVEPVGEGDAAGNMITDVTSGADVYGFAQDQLTRLVTANALEEVNPDFLADVESANSAGVVEAGKVGGTLYAYPMTADNGYFLYYDKSVVTDPSTLEGIVEQCEAAGKNFYMDLTGWYQVAFFFGTGCQLTYDTDDAGNFTKCNVDYASDKGLVALKEMVELASSSSFQAGSSAGDAVNYAAIIDGTWDAATVKEVLGDNYACAKLPTFTGSDGKEYQMSGFNGCKLLGVKPQEDEDKLQICDDLAYYLTSEKVQLARFEAVQWGPANLNAQASDAVQANEALAALSEQFAYTIPQGNYPGDYWTRSESLAGDVKGDFQKASDEDLTKALETYQADLESYAK
ncbi:arabinogalactan oligomer / maltooligosaccharide transport system substrate-binding protein [Butyrivibrio sp. INlla18]|uniref:extracellular solute-binding protein n=1 Tax=Butyrivibrio sp. INlla18 TaxID=1520806 RepID=UPI0008808204|nr:extracellular solute-binding protein [Butyrivibrio sp. INlla18]SDA66656.1 arabinogalactan oligomer / maltooligosaccharide transport system substrate-binding protein [Butyrivibrio sp. INlla18]